MRLKNKCKSKIFSLSRLQAENSYIAMLRISTSAVLGMTMKTSVLSFLLIFLAVKKLENYDGYFCHIHEGMSKFIGDLFNECFFLYHIFGEIFLHFFWQNIQFFLKKTSLNILATYSKHFRLSRLQEEKVLHSYIAMFGISTSVALRMATKPFQLWSKLEERCLNYKPTIKHRWLFRYHLLIHTVKDFKYCCQTGRWSPSVRLSVCPKFSLFFRIFSELALMILIKFGEELLKSSWKWMVLVVGPGIHVRLVQGHVH